MRILKNSSPSASFSIRSCNAPTGNRFWQWLSVVILFLLMTAVPAGAQGQGFDLARVQRATVFIMQATIRTDRQLRRLRDDCQP
jgi:hypothetical protein